MIENLSSITKMLQLVYFNEQKALKKDKQHFSRHRPVKNTKYCQSQWLANCQELELLSLLSSQENCENWLFLIEKYKDHYVVQQQLYQCIMQSTVSVHNLFLMLIQCRVLPPQVWIPIQKLCRLSGDRQNQLCCLVHFTILNMGKGSNIFNPPVWSFEKASMELSSNFCKVYNRNNMSLKEQVSILPMLMVLSKKNSQVLWIKLPWLYQFPLKVITHLKQVMEKILKNGLSETVAQMDPDYFMSRVCVKAIQLLEVEGFISARGLFSFVYQLFNLSSILELLADFSSSYQQTEHSQEQQQSYSIFREQLKYFVIEILKHVSCYEFEFAPIHSEMGSKDLLSLQIIIIQNKLYLDELADDKFQIQLNDLIETVCKKKPNPNGQYAVSLSRLLACVPSSALVSRAQDHAYMIPYPQLGETSSLQNINIFVNREHNSILTLLLLQLYNLRMDYLLILLEILANSSEIVEEAWSEGSSTFHGVQLYLQKNHLLEFLIWNFNAIETKNDIGVMLAYFKVFGYMLKGNPLCYAMVDRIITDMEVTTETDRERHGKVKGNRMPLIDYFTSSFRTNISVSKQALFMLLADQFEWKENDSQEYPNANYTSLLINKVIDCQRNNWMVRLTEGICLMHIDSQNKEHEDQKNQWITLLLLLYYYFEETSKLRSKVAQEKETKQKGKGITVPNKAYLDQMINQELFMEQLYPVKLKVPLAIFKGMQVVSSRPLESPHESVVTVRLLSLLVGIIDQWEQTMNKGSKSKIISYGFSYATLRLWKKKFRSRLAGFIKAKEFEEECFI